MHICIYIYIYIYDSTFPAEKLSRRFSCNVSLREGIPPNCRLNQNMMILLICDFERFGSSRQSQMEYITRWMHLMVAYVPGIELI